MATRYINGLLSTVDINQTTDLSSIKVFTGTARTDGQTLEMYDENTSSWLVLAGSETAGTTFRTVTTTDTILSTDDVILCSPSAAITLTLPAASGLEGKFYRIKNLANYQVTIDGNGTETIDESLTFALQSKYESVTLLCDGSEWYIV